jgi:NAD(P)-dependent dehydrogenase (short-subunit alcohol dehydrogenase family)
MKISFKTAIITGSSRGLGRAIRAGAQRGANAIKDWVHAGWTHMRRRVTPSDVAYVRALLCSDEASLLTGQTIVIDGGSSLMNPDFPLALPVPK